MMLRFMFCVLGYNDTKMVAQCQGIKTELAKSVSQRVFKLF
jgi:hypothetical protein